MHSFLWEGLFANELGFKKKRSFISPFDLNLQNFRLS